jgi:hypothetical protein
MTGPRVDGNDHAVPVAVALRASRFVVGFACAVFCTAGCEPERGEADTAATRGATNRTVAPPPPLPSVTDSTQAGRDGEALDAATLDRFTAAVIGVQGVETELAFSLSRVGRPDEVGMLRDAARRERIRAVERTGMSPEEYARIARLIEQDPALRARLERRLRASHASKPNSSAPRR